MFAGRIVRSEEGATGFLPSTVDSCEWSFTVEPQCGWGDVGGRQRPTAGWLAALPVFEPHWQVRNSVGAPYQLRLLVVRQTMANLSLP